jgi:hypothetical protein
MVFVGNLPLVKAVANRLLGANLVKASLGNAEKLLPQFLRVFPEAPDTRPQTTLKFTGTNGWCIHKHECTIT